MSWFMPGLRRDQRLRAAQMEDVEHVELDGHFGEAERRLVSGVERIALLPLA